jgi:L-amino acid N-acyltransferase YncA
MIRICKAKINESQKIRKLEEKVWKEKNVTDKYDIANFVRFGYVFVAKEKNKIIGAIIAMKTKVDKIYVGDWVVDKRYRRKGIGTMLYKALIRKVEGKTLIAFVEPNNTKSLKAHSRLGFRIIRKIEDTYNLGKSCRLLLKR